MNSTARLGLQKPQTSDAATGLRTATGTNADKLDDAALDLQGTLASRPISTPGSPGIRGRYYYATDTGVLYRDTGSGWIGLNEPIGTIIDYAGSGDPSDPAWLLADGRALSRATYAVLFQAVGGTSSPWGMGDGSTTFNLPDLRGRVAVGADNMGTAAGAANRIPNSNRQRGQSGGEERHQLTTGEMPAHSHGNNVGETAWFVNDASKTVTVPTGGSDPFRIGIRSASMSNAGGGGAHNNMQPYAVTNKLIRVL